MSVAPSIGPGEPAGGGKMRFEWYMPAPVSQARRVGEAWALGKKRCSSEWRFSLGRSMNSA